MTPDIAAQSFGLCPITVTQAGLGGNNRLYHVDCGNNRVFALKFYPQTPGDSRNRKDTEFQALKFLRKAGVDNVPRALDSHPGDNFALYEWIEGKPPQTIDLKDIDQALEFILTLKKISFFSSDMNLASEACLSLGEITRQIGNRLEKLQNIAQQYPLLEQFLADFVSVFEKFASNDLTEISPLKRILSPSDFGFHNAIRAPNGELIFIDFEYFGWDDPVKLVADFLWHPGMALSAEQKNHFRQKALEIFDFSERLELAYPLYGLRWIMILLNEYLPERWERRQAAGNQDDLQTVLARQLAKAQKYLEAIKHG